MAIRLLGVIAALLLTVTVNAADPPPSPVTSPPLESAAYSWIPGTPYSHPSLSPTQHPVPDYIRTGLRPRHLHRWPYEINPYSRSMVHPGITHSYVRFWNLYQPNSYSRTCR